MTDQDFAARFKAARARGEQRRAARRESTSAAVLQVVDRLPKVRGGSNALARREALLERMAALSAMTDSELDQRRGSLMRLIAARGKRDDEYELRAASAEQAARRRAAA